jgi:hypothetical protein
MSGETIDISTAGDGSNSNSRMSCFKGRFRHFFLMRGELGTRDVNADM